MSSTQTHHSEQGTANGRYDFERGYPLPETTQRARDDEDYQRAVVAYHFWYPTVSMEGIFNGNRIAGLEDNIAASAFPAGPRQVAFTANSDTPYGAAVIDLTDGPYVIELPPGPFIALADDHHQRWIMDMGIPGPDAGKGGKHLILPPDFNGDVPAGFHAARSSSYKILLAFRSMPQDGDVDAATQALHAIKIYPLRTASSPRLVKFAAVKGDMDSTCLRWEDNLQFWEVLHRVLDAEPVVDEFAPMYGLLAALGIDKGKPFAPDARMRAILERAAKNGRDQLIVSAFDSARSDRIAWPDRRWEWIGLVSDNADFETPGGMDLEARDRWFAQAIVTSPAMFRRSPGAGSLYWLAVRDRSGAYLDGGKTYKLSVPQPVPAQLFWSVTAYDSQTRSEVQTDQNQAALRSLIELKDAAKAATADLYFGPQAPQGQEARWIKTAPNRGWFAYFRIYGPSAPAFDGSWKPGDFEEVQ